VDGVRKQRDAARERDHDKLQEGCRHKPYERPLDGPDTALGGRYGGVHGPVGMPVFAVPVVVAVFFVV